MNEYQPCFTSESMTEASFNEILKVLDVEKPKEREKEKIRPSVKIIQSVPFFNNLELNKQRLSEEDYLDHLGRYLKYDRKPAGSYIAT